MKNKKDKTFQEELAELLERRGVKEFKGKTFDEILLETAKPMLEKLLNSEMDEHLGYEKHEQSDSDNSRNGYSSKNVKGLFGSTEIKTPRDRGASFEPIIVQKNQSNISSVEEAIILMYAKGQSTRDITEHIKEIYKFNLDPTSISRITDKILPDVEAFQNKPLQKTYAVVFIDGIRFKIREEGVSKEVSVYIPLGIDLEGKKDVLGYWIGESETSKYWLSVFDDMKQRGLKDILIMASDNLPGISEAIAAAYPKTKIQKCVVHQIRNSMKFVKHDEKKEFVKDMKKIYQATNLKEAEKGLENFEEKWSKKYGYATRSWRKNFDELVTFFEFPSEIRKLIYTTNPIENLNRNIRKISKNKSFPNMKSLSKVIYLAIRNQTKKWNLPIRNWGIIYNQLSILFELD